MHYVVGFQFSFDGSRVALIRKKRPEWQAGLWNGIGGHVERGESAHDAMVREFTEETGVSRQGFLWLPFADLRTWTQGLVSFFFSFTDQVELVRSTTDEEVRVIDLRQPSFSAIKDMLVPNVGWLIEMALSMRVVESGGKAGRELSSFMVVSETPPLIRASLSNKKASETT